MTQKEIARKLNVSQATVSMALKGSARISQTLRDSVRKLADDSGYLPNLAGQLLRQGRCNVIGIVFPSLVNSFYAELYQELQRKLQPHGYLLYTSPAPTLRRNSPQPRRICDSCRWPEWWLSARRRKNSVLCGKAESRWSSMEGKRRSKGSARCFPTAIEPAWS